MKKLIAVMLILTLALSVTAALADPEDMQGKAFPDFTAKTIDGKTFKLSEALKTHDLVLINFWATWCGPCCMEFPYLEAAWEQYSDRVAVIALSVERSDSVTVLRKFAKEYGLNFPVGRDEKNQFSKMGGQYIPTTLILDKEGRVLLVEVGAKGSVEEFTELFDSLLPQ